MFFMMDAKQLDADHRIHQAMFGDRGRQFVERHRWNLGRNADGLEIDEYDDGAATYCLSVEGKRHLASLRLRPAGAGCMVEKHFPSLWLPELADGVEVTRFCAAPGLAPEERMAAVSELLLGLCRYCQRSRIGSIFGIVFPSVRRALQQAGWHGDVLRSVPSPEGGLLLVRWQASELVAWTIQERRELREEALKRRTAAWPAELAAA